MSCPNCGQEARGRFCTMCGARLEGTVQRPAMPDLGATWSGTLTGLTPASRPGGTDVGSTVMMTRADLEEIAARVGVGRQAALSPQSPAPTVPPMSPEAGAAGPGEALVHQSRHFRIHYPAGSFAAQNLAALVDRLDQAYDAAVDLLGGDIRTGKITVYLADLVQDAHGRPLDQGGYVDVGSMQIREVYRSDAPGEGLERSVLLVLLSVATGTVAPPPTAIVDGLLARLMQRSGAFPSNEELMPTLAQAKAQGQLPSLQMLIGGPSPETQGIYFPAAASFVGFLLDAFGVERLKAFLRAAAEERLDTAARSTFQRSPADLEKSWQKTLKQAQPGGILAFVKLASVYLRPYRLPVAEIIFYLALSVAFGIGMAKMQGILLDRAILPHDGHALAVVMGILIGAFILVSLTSLRESYLLASVAESVLRELRTRMFSLVQRLHPGFFQEMDTGDIMSRMTSDLAAVQFALTGALAQGLRMIMTLVAAVVTIFLTDWKLALIAMVATPLFFITGRYLGPPAARASRERQENLASATSTLQENLGTQPVVKALGLEQRMIDTYRRDLDTLFRSSLRLTFLSGLFGLTSNSIASGIQLVVLGFGAWLVMGGSMTVGTLFAFLALMGQIIGPMLSISAVMQGLQQASGAMSRVDELLKAQPAIENAPDAQRLGRLSQGIRFEDVGFSYTPAQPTLQHLSVDIPAGFNVALVGPSGCGKSTMLNLIMRFYDPQEGSVSLDGVDLRRATLESLRGQMGIVFQENVLFNISVRENIRLGKLDASDDEVEAAAKAAEIHELIMSLPQGYDTVVGERGSRLSGGQRQRMGIARAIIRNPAILLLDEATSALDPSTEAAINETLSQLARGRTTISVTHRLSSVVNVDRIYVLDRGKLVEQGTHDQLVRQGGLYAQLWHEQGGVGAEVSVEIANLRDVPMLAELPADLLGSLARRLVIERYPAGEVIVRRGDAGDRLYIVHRGQVEVFAANPDAHQPPLAILREGDHFGEIALLYDVPRTATVRARTPVELYSLQRRDFDALLTSVPGLRGILQHTMAERARASAG